MSNTERLPRMFYRARNPETGRMWDNWLFFHEGRYFLFYLATGPDRDRWDNVSLAISEDGVSWREHGVVIRRHPDVTWVGSGSVWASPNFADDGKFIIGEF